MAGSVFRAMHVEPDAASPRQRRPARARCLLAALGSGLTAGRAGVVSWYRSFGDRRLLASLDDRQLRDLGLDRSELGDSTASCWRLHQR